MIFNSVTYLVFLTIVIPLYWSLPQRLRLWLLFLSGIVFYGFWRIEFVFLMLFTSYIDYFAGLRMAASVEPGKRRYWLMLSVSCNLIILCYFKYLFFFASSAVSLANVLGADLAQPMWNIILPLGISFYTFHSMSYAIDVYRGRVQPVEDYLLYGCFVTNFPQLVAGPILRVHDVVPQLEQRQRFAVDDLNVGLRRILFGLFLKVVVADNISPLVDDGFAQPASALFALDVWTLAFLFGFQIYFDFSAYSHIAIGSARLMGVRFPENFNFPYMATSPRDFWQRWHISLSSWIRDYLYLPLMGSRPARSSSSGGLPTDVSEKAGMSRNGALFATWAIMGLWHGANWTFVAWGLYHAAIIYLHRLAAPLGNGLPRVASALGGWAVTLPLMMLGWIFFRANDLSQALGMYGKVLHPSTYGVLGLRENTYLVAALLLAGIAVVYLFRQFVQPRVQRLSWVYLAGEVPILAAVTSLVFVFLRPISQFIYFQF